MYNANSQIKFETLMLRSTLWNYSDAYVLVKVNITVANVTFAAEAAASIIFQKVIFQTCTRLTDSISEINKMQLDNPKGSDVGMPMYNLIEYSSNYSKHGEVYGYIIEINQFQFIMVLLLLVLCYHLKIKHTKEVQKILSSNFRKNRL